VIFVSVASKGVSLPVKPLESTLMRWLTSAHSKGLKCGRLRLKTGKTRCLSASADSKRVKGIGEQKDRATGDRGKETWIRLRKEFGNRRGWDWTNTEEDSTP
jgi:hypothetical protein